MLFPLQNNNQIESFLNKRFQKGRWITKEICNHHNTPAVVYFVENLRTGFAAALKIEIGKYCKLQKEVSYFIENQKLGYWPKIYSYGAYGNKGYYCLMEYLDERYSTFDYLFSIDQLDTSSFSALLHTINNFPLAQIKNENI